MGSGGGGAVWEVTRDRSVVLLAATEMEATPLRAALLEAEEHLIASKLFYMGTLGVEAPPFLGGDSPGGVGKVVRTVLAITGCDKANTAHSLTCLLESAAPVPRLVIQVGIAGAFPVGTPPPEVGDIVIATHEAYSDTGSSSPDGWLSAAELGLPIACLDGSELGGRFPLDAGLASAAAAVMEGLDWSGAGGSGPTGSSAGGSGGVPVGAGRSPAVLLGPCVTASRVTGLRAEAEAIVARWGALAESMEGAAAAHICALYRVPFLEIRGISNLAGDRDRATWQVERAAAVAGRAALAAVAALDRLPLQGRKTA